MCSKYTELSKAKCVRECHVYETSVGVSNTCDKFVGVYSWHLTKRGNDATNRIVYLDYRQTTYRVKGNPRLPFIYFSGYAFVKGKL